MKRVHLIRPSFLVFLIVPVALLITYQLYGLPHVIASYAWRDEGQGHAPFARRYYTRCTYVGSYGAFTEAQPTLGKCHWFVMRKEKFEVSR